MAAPTIINNAYTLISQDYPNTYIVFDLPLVGGESNAPEGLITLNLIDSKPIRIEYSKGGGNEFKTTGFIYKNISTSTQSYEFNWENTVTGESSKYFYAISSLPAQTNINFISTKNYSNKREFTTFGMGTIFQSWKSVSKQTLSIDDVPVGYYVSIIGSANQSSTDNLGTLPSENGTCFTDTAMILMGDLTWKRISEIKRGDVVISDFETKKTQIVSRVIINSGILTDAFIIPKGLIGNSVDLTCTKHPVFVKNGTERRYTSDIIGVTKTKTFESFYTLQFDQEGTYYIEGIKVDSLSPYFHTCKLPEEYFINPANNKNLTMYTENDEHRNKPIHKKEQIKPEFVDLIDLSSLKNKLN